MAISRRDLLRAIGAVTAFVLTGEIGWHSMRNVDSQPAIAAPPKDDMATKQSHQWAAVVDLRRCDGCKYCTNACQITHYLPKEMEWIQIYEINDENGNHFYMPRLCMQCENPPCLKVCPVAATFKSEEGVILVNQDRCIGCRLCMAACPYEARYFNFRQPPQPPASYQNPMPEFPVPQRKGTVGKCVLCVHYIDQGKLPACVEACPMGALYIADLNTRVMTNRAGETYEMSRYLEENDGFRFREELNTSPRVWYVAGHGQTIEGQHWS